MVTKTRKKSAKTTDRLMENDALRGIYELLQVAAGDSEVVEYDELGFRRHPDPDIVFPTGLTIPAGINHLDKINRDHQSEVDIHATIEAFPMDVAVAFTSAVKSVAGYALGKAQKSFFGKRNPQSVSVQIDADGNKEKVYWGQFEVPNLDGTMTITAELNGEIPSAVIYGTVRKMYRNIFDHIIDTTKENLRNNSIYKGKSVRFDMAWLGKERFDPFRHTPTFFKTPFTENDLILNPGIVAGLKIGLWGYLQNYPRLADINLRFHNGVLLAGPHGTGKTLTGTVAARMANENGISFFYVESAENLKNVVRMVRQYYQPAVLFVEDIDTMLAGERNKEMNTLLNEVMDGLMSKNDEIVLVMTTNHPELMAQGAIRPGRTSSVIFYDEPRDETLLKFIEHYSKDGKGETLLAEPLDPKRLAVLPPMMPTFVQAIVERAKIEARFYSGAKNGGLITNDHIIAQFRGIEQQLELFNKAKTGREVSDVDAAMAVLATAFVDKLPGGGQLAGKIIEVMEDHLNDCAFR